MTDHTYAFTGAQIASAASRLADELEAEIPTGAAEDARATLQAEIGNAIERMLDSETISSRDQWAHDQWAHGSIRLSQTDDGRDAIELDPTFRRRLVWAVHEVSRARKRIAELRAAAARYKTQPDRSYEFDSYDVAQLGLDREAPPTRRRRS